MNFSTPTGFRDVLPSEAEKRAQVISRVQACFNEYGYSLIETPTLEIMDVVQAGMRVPIAPFKFFDSQGDLLAIRPDVTMQIARTCTTRLKRQEPPFKFRYTHRVFREADGQPGAAPREITQLGIESIGSAGPDSDAEVLTMFAEALMLAGLDDFQLSVGTVSILRELIEKSGLDPLWKSEVLDSFHNSNFVKLSSLVEDGLQEAARGEDCCTACIEAIGKLPHISGGKEAITQVRKLVGAFACTDGLDVLEATLDLLAPTKFFDKIVVDFSVMSSFDYYTGLVVEAYAPEFGEVLGSGGRYDGMLAAYGRDLPAAGFGFSLESLMAAQDMQSAALPPTLSGTGEKPLRIAIPKGSLNADSIQILKEAGLNVDGLDNPGRQLVIRHPGIEYIIVRPSDAPSFVSLGAADCGICGKDSLLESDTEVVELVDLAYGACRFIVAKPQGQKETAVQCFEEKGSVRVATKYPRIAQRFFDEKGMQVDIIKLHGNIELAPLTGLAELIVDITATGTTLRENNLEIVDEVLSSSARFFANGCAFRTDARVVQLAQKLQESQMLMAEREDGQ